MLVYECGRRRPIHSGLVMRGAPGRRPAASRRSRCARPTRRELGPRQRRRRSRTRTAARADASGRSTSSARRPRRRASAVQPSISTARGSSTRPSRRRRARRVGAARRLGDALLLEGSRLPARRRPRRLGRADRARLGGQVSSSAARSASPASSRRRRSTRSTTTSNGSPTTTRGRGGSPRAAVCLDPERSRRTSSRSTSIPGLTARGARAPQARRAASATCRSGMLRAVTHLDITDDDIDARDRAHAGGARCPRLSHSPPSSSASSAREQRDKRLPSIAAAVLRDGELIWEKAVGAADVAAA